MAIKSNKSLLTLSIFLFLIFLKTTSSLSNDQNHDDIEEDLSFLEEDESTDHSADDSLNHLGYYDDGADGGYGADDGGYGGDDNHDFENYDDLNDDDAPGSYGGGESGAWDESGSPEVDEKDVIVLNETNFDEVIEKNRYVMVEFYAPWCGHCQSLAPEYAAAATELKAEEIVLAKVDATENSELSQKFDVEGFPTVFFFVDGVKKLYNGDRTKDAIVAWVKKKTGPELYNLTTTEEAQKILEAGKPVVLGYLSSLEGLDSVELAAASKLEDDIDFYQTANSDVAKLFHIDPEVKRPALVMIKKEAEGIYHFSGEFTKSNVAEFVTGNKLPLVITLTQQTAQQVFENPIKKQLLLFATSKDAEEYLPIFKEAATQYKGKVVSVYVQLDNEEVGQQVSEYFGVRSDAPSVLAYTGNEDSRKFLMDGEISLTNIKSFAEKFLEDNLKPFYKSDPIPEMNEGDVKIVVGNNFDEIVLNESKDVLLEIYAPWCGHCQALEPTYNKLAKHLRGIDSLVIAKMDGSMNEHPRAKADGFPTILFFPAGNKSFDPITVDTDRTVVAFYKFLKKHASIPFKLQKQAKEEKAKDIDAKESQESASHDSKDEL